MLLSLALVGCGPLVVAYPPPAMLPDTVAPLDAREIQAGAAVGGLPTSGGLATLYSGPFVADAGVGLGHHVDVSVTGTGTWQGPSAGIAGQYWLIDREDFGMAAVAGVAGSVARGVYDEDVPVGDQVDENGDPVTTPIKRPYAYLSVAPSLGTRAAWRFARTLSLPILVRASWATTAPIAYLGADDMEHTLWVETMTGLSWTPNPTFSAALGAGVLVSLDDGFPWPRVTASAHVRIPTRRRD